MSYQSMFINAYNNVMNRQHVSVVDALKAVTDYYYTNLVSKNDQRLLKLAFKENITQKDLDKFLLNWDIEQAGSAKALLLSYIMKIHPDLEFNDYNGPRLKGVLNFYRFNNLTLLSHYTKIGHELNNKGIIPMIIKGGAMKYLRPELPRNMGDIDILVFGKEEYETAKQTALNLGYVYEDNKHSIDLHTPGQKDGICDIHQYIEIESKYDKKVLRKFKERAAKKIVFGVETYVPCFEDLLFISMVNLVKNIRNNTSIQGILFSLFDFEYLKTNKPDFDWQIIMNNIRTMKAYPQMLIAMEFANKLVPGILPDFVVQDKKMLHYAHRYFNRDIYYSRYIHAIRATSGKTRLHDVHSLKDFFRYANIKLTKQIRWFVLQHPFLIDTWLKIASKSGEK